jgi:transcriptional regulator with XRE-family HTH domain
MKKTQSIAEQLARYEKEHDVSKERLADMLGVRVQTLYRWLNGSHEPSRLAKDRMKECGIIRT